MIFQPIITYKRGKNPTMYENLNFIYGGKFVSKGEWIHPRRTIDSIEIILVVRGSVYITLDEKEYTLTKGDILRIDPAVLHYGTKISDGEVSFYWVHFSGADERELPPIYFRPENFQQAELLVRQLLHYFSTDGYPKECSDSLLKVFLAELNFLSVEKCNKNDKLYSEVREWVRINSDEALKVSDIAKRFGYNVDYLNRVFKTHYPQGLKAYIDSMRMQRIKQDLLGEQLSLKEISSKYKFDDYKYFLKYFKYHEGISPKDYRKLYYNIHTNNK